MIYKIYCKFWKGVIIISLHCVTNTHIIFCFVVLQIFWTYVIMYIASTYGTQKRTLFPVSLIHLADCKYRTELQFKIYSSYVSIILTVRGLTNRRMLITEFTLLDYRVTNQIYLSLTRNTSSA